MEDLSSNTPKQFFNHVFNFEEESKHEILNLLQYALLSVVPIMILNKTMEVYVPNEDETKSTLEISAEIVIQIIAMFIGMILIHRIVTFIPTSSGKQYPLLGYNSIFMVLPVLIITMSLQTKLGEKVSILSKRAIRMWNNNKENFQQQQPLKPSSPNTSTILLPQQPMMIQQQQQQQQPPPNGIISTPIHELIGQQQQPQHTISPTMQQQQQQQQSFDMGPEPFSAGSSSFATW